MFNYVKTVYFTTCSNHTNYPEIIWKWKFIYSKTEFNFYEKKI